MIQWLRINLLLACMVVLAACGSGAASDSGAPPVASASAVVAAPSMSAAAAVEPSADVAVEPSSAASTTNGSSPGGSAGEGGTVASFTRSGGMQGKTQTLVVNGDGTLQLLNGDEAGQVFKTAQADSVQIDALRSLLASQEWQELQGKYGRQVPDGFAYTVSANGKQVLTYDGATNPPALENVLTQLNALWQTAQTAP